jgi:homospermidine synthase
MTLQLHGRIDGPIVMIGFGSIGRGTLPLMLRHFDCDRSKITIIDPDDRERRLAEQEGVRFEKAGVTRENYRDLLLPLLAAGPGQGFMVNLSVDVSSGAMVELCREATRIGRRFRIVACSFRRSLTRAIRGSSVTSSLGDAVSHSPSLQ